MPGTSSATGFIHDYTRILRLIWAASPRTAAIGGLLALVSAAVLPAQIWFTKLIIDGVANIVTESSKALAVTDWQAVLTPVVALALVRAGGIVCQARLEHFKWRLSEGVRHHIEYLVLQKASRLDIAFFENPTFHDRMATVLREAYRAHNLAWISLELLGTLAGLCAMLSMLLHLHPLAIVALVLTTAPGALAAGHFAKRFYNLVNSHASIRRMAAYYQELLSSRDAVKEIRVFGLGTPFLDRFHQYWQEHITEETDFRASRERVGVGLESLSLAGTVGIWTFAIVQAVRSRITLGDVTLVLQASEQARQGLTRLLSQAGQIYENNLFTRDLLHLLDLDSGGVEGALSPALTIQVPAPRPIRRGFEFCNVSFRYPGASHDVVKDVSFRLAPGETVALVGENGAGKTTLVKLLARLYDPSEGIILLDGRDLREYDLDDLRCEIGIIFQDFVRYDLTVRENIAVGQMELAEDGAQVRAAAEKGGALPIIERLPAGLDSMLGRRFADGLDLSGGEWQRIALSRAFLRQAQILILDEPTAALDALAERELYGRFSELTAGKMTLFVSHRFSTVRTADRILVLEGGSLSEAGSHDELIASKGHYARMFTAQAERYQ